MAETMMAAVKTKPEPSGTEIKSVEIPKPGPHDVLIKIKRASICGTDVHIYNWDAWASDRIPVPMIYGHEFAGTVVDIGDEVKYVEAGDYVSGECHITCGHCYQCRNGMAHVCRNVKIFGVDVPGIFAEYAVIPAANVWKNDPSVSPDICSIQDPLGNAVHSVFSTDIVGKDVAIMGMGPIGLMSVAICHHVGASNVFAIDLHNEYRLELARKVEADEIFTADDPELHQKILKKTNGKGVDIVLEMSGSVNAVKNGLKFLRTGGDLILLGLYPEKATIDITNDIVFKYITVKGINGRRIFGDWQRMRGLLNNEGIKKDLETIITDRFKFEDFHKAMEKMRSGKSGKVILTFEE